MMKQNENHDTKEKESTLNEELYSLIGQIKDCLDLKDPEILDLIVQHYDDIVGEKDNIKLLFLAAISRKLPKSLRIHVSNFSSSGSGKSWVTRKVLKPFWHDVEEITTFTDAWFSRTVDELDGKILLWQEISRTDEQGRGATGNIKILLSDEGISYRCMEQTSDGWVPKNRHSNALPVVMTTTTRIMNTEDGRRFVTLNSDESQEQTERIIKHSLTKASSINASREIAEKYSQLEVLCKIYEKMAERISDVIIPFAPNIEKMIPKHMQMRTYIDKIIQIVKLVAFIHALNRKIILVEDRNETYLVAQIEDFKEAMNISSKIFLQTNHGLSANALKLYQFVEERINQEDSFIPSSWPSIKECEEELGIPHSTFYTHLNHLVDNGFLQTEKIEGSKEKCVMLTTKHMESFSDEDLDFTEEQFGEWFNNEFNGNEKMTSWNECFHMYDD